MEAEAERVNVSSTSRKITRTTTLSSSAAAVAKMKKKKKPFSDLTNLCNPKPSIPIPFPKPYKPNSNSNANSISQKPGLNNSPISDSSIASSNFNSNIAANLRSSSPIPGKKLSAGKAVSKGKNVGIPASLQEKAKDNEKGLNAVSVGLHFPPVEKTKDKGKANAMLSSASAVENTKDKGKKISGNLSFPSLEKTHDKGKLTAASSDSISLERVKDKVKKINAIPGLPSLAKPKDKGKAVDEPENFHTPEKRKGVASAFSCPPQSRTRNIGNELNEAGDSGLSKFYTDPHLKHKKKRHCLPRDQDAPKYCYIPQDSIEKQKAYFEEVDDFELLEEEVTDNEWIKEEGGSKLHYN